MSVFNLGVVFGPTLLRPQEETVAAILDIKFNNIVINILIENYERIFRNDPNSLDTYAMQTSKNTSSPPVRIPRTNQASKSLSGNNSTGGSGGGGGGPVSSSSGHAVVGGVHGSGSGPSSTVVSRNSIYSTPTQQQQQQQQHYRLMSKASSNFDSSISSSLQNIPNGLVYVHGGAVTNSLMTTGSSGGGGGGGIGMIPTSSNAPNGNLLNSHITNGTGSSSGSKSLGLSVNMGSVKNLHSMSQSDISLRRAGGATDSVYNILSSNGKNGGGFTAHHATPAKATTTTSSLRHDYLLTGTSGTSPLPITSSNNCTSSSMAMAGSNNSSITTTVNRLGHQTSNISPPTLAMRKEALYGTGNGPQQHPPVQLQRSSNHLPYMMQTKQHYSSVAAASTSSSNESVCDSLSSTNGIGGGGGAMSGSGMVGGGLSGSSGVSLLGGGIGGGSGLLTNRTSLDYINHSNQNMNSLVTMSGASCDDIVTASMAPSSLLLSGSGNINNITPPNEYIPHKMHRSKDLQQIKRDLDAGSA